jgi:molecular chaperone DnaK
MRHYIGIDLGTTNSAICSYDGEKVRIWKSPEQNDVTPSAIYIDKRGNRYYGRRAYEIAPMDDQNTATLFKRYMGTNTKFKMHSADLSLTPEECSAEILKVLYGYLSEDIRNDPDTATVITVPAAFNQMKKDATKEAARLAGIGNVALMTEPVAAISSVMRSGRQEGIFLIYDLGGGTFDISIAENINGNVTLLSQGGKEMCGGRDWDKLIFSSIVVPWLHGNFNLPDKFHLDDRFARLYRLALRASEQAKIELSARDDTVIRMDDAVLNCVDLDGKEIYINIPFTRDMLNGLIAETIDDTIAITRETMANEGIAASNVEKIVFIGGPTNYKPLRDQVASALGLPVSLEVNPMTAVAEGASIFAESIDWSSEKHNRKTSSAEANAEADVSFRYTARTSGNTARIVFLLKDTMDRFVEITCTDTGWSSGRAAIHNESALKLPLSRDGENTFDVTIYDVYGQALPLKESRIVITKTIATIEAIPASYSIGVKALDKLGGSPVLVYLVRKNDALPKTGQETFKAGQTLIAGSNDALIFTLWEGDIESPIEDNRYIGTYKIPGTSFESGIIPTGAEIICDYEMSDSGALHLGVSVPCIGADFGNHNYYSRQEGQTDLDATSKMADDGRAILSRIDALDKKIDDPKLQEARNKAGKAAVISDDEHDSEEAQEAYNDLLEAKKLISRTRKEHLKEIRQMDLDALVNAFNQEIRKFAKPSESGAFDNLAKTAQRSIHRNDSAFENQYGELRDLLVAILWRQDFFVINQFHSIIQHPYNFTDATRFDELVRDGKNCVDHDDINKLRAIVAELIQLQIRETLDENMFDDVNIIRG